MAKKKKPKLSHLAFGDSLAQDSDIVIFLDRDENHEQVCEATLHIVKARRCKKFSFDINFDIEAGNYKYLGES